MQCQTRPTNNTCSTIQAFQAESVFDETRPFFYYLVAPGQPHLQYYSSTIYAPPNQFSLVQRMGGWLRAAFYVIIKAYKLAFLPTASIDKSCLVIIMQFSIDKMIKRTYNSITIYRIDVGIIAPLSCVRNQIATFGLFKDNRQ